MPPPGASRAKPLRRGRSGRRSLRLLPLHAREKGDPAICLTQGVQHRAYEPKVETEQNEGAHFEPMKNYPVEHVGLLLRDLAWSSDAPSGRPARLELHCYLP